jgi:hypothetical protein
MNLLIAIMSDTFGRVTAIEAQSKLREICNMITENEFVLNRDSVFKNSKYVIIARLEKAATSERTWEGQIGTLKSFFNEAISATRSEMNTNNKNLDAKFSDCQSKYYIFYINCIYSYCFPTCLVKRQHPKGVLKYLQDP